MARKDPGRRRRSRPSASFNGISQRTQEEQYTSCTAYVAKTNEIQKKLDSVDAARRTRSSATCARFASTFVRPYGGVKNHELYFSHLGGSGWRPGPTLELINRDFRRTTRAARGLQGLRPRGRAAGCGSRTITTRPRSTTIVGDAQNTFPMWNATPILAMDVYEHAYWVRLRPAHAKYIEASSPTL